MNIKRIFTIIILCFAPMLFSIGVCAKEDMRGVWVSTVYNLDFPSAPTTDSNRIKTEIDTIVANCKSTGYNAIFLQVRPSADAIYPSDIFTWSSYLTGTNGVMPDNNFDPLGYWIEKCNENSIELHAWINPYRVTKNGDEELNSLPYNHVAKQNPDWLVKYSDGNYYFNPGIPEVRELVKAGVREILENYDVDGIHMDDYFYPGRDFADNDTYSTYNNEEFSDIADWRRNNVNILVKELCDITNGYGKIFGISPSGIWDNKKSNPLGSDTNGKSSYSELFADSRAWVLNGYVDYIAPQIYWEFGYSVADYGILAKWWEDVCKDTDVKLYIGLASYRANGAKETSPWYNGEETARQMEYNKNSARIDGEIHFRYKLIQDTPSAEEKIHTAYIGSIDVLINGKRLISDTPPVIQNNRTLVPMRAVFEALGATVLWHNDTRTAIAKKDSSTLSVSIGDSFLTVDGRVVNLDVPACIIGTRTYVPLRAVSESFGFDVFWDQGNNRVVINDYNITTENDDMPYINEELGFKLMFPSSWKDYYKVTETDGGIAINFYGKSLAGRGAATGQENGLIMFFVLDGNTATSEELDSITKIGTAKNMDYYFASGRGFDLEPIALIDEETAQWYLELYGSQIYGESQIPLINDDWKKAQQMQNDIKIILKTFEELPKSVDISTKKQSNVPYLGDEEITPLFTGRNNIRDWLKDIKVNDAEYVFYIEGATGEARLDVMTSDILGLKYNIASFYVEENEYANLRYNPQDGVFNTLPDEIMCLKVIDVLCLDFENMGIYYNVRGIVKGSSAADVKIAFLNMNHEIDYTGVTHQELYNMDDVHPNAKIDPYYKDYSLIRGMDTITIEQRGFREIIYFHAQLYDNENGNYSVWYSQSIISFLIDTNGKVDGLIYIKEHRN